MIKVQKYSKGKGFRLTLFVAFLPAFGTWVGCRHQVQEQGPNVPPAPLATTSQPVKPVVPVSPSPGSLQAPVQTQPVRAADSGAIAPAVLAPVTPVPVVKPIQAVPLSDPQGPVASQSYPKGIVSMRFMKPGSCKKGCKDALVQVELENQAPIPRWFVLPSANDVSIPESGGIRLVRTYRFISDDGQIVMGEFEGTRSFRAVLMAPSSKVILKNVPLRILPGKPESLSVTVIVTNQIHILSAPGEAETSIDVWISGGAVSQVTAPETVLNLAPVDGHNFEGLAGAIQSQDGKERTVQFDADASRLSVMVGGFR